MFFSVVSYSILILIQHNRKDVNGEAKTLVLVVMCRSLHRSHIGRHGKYSDDSKNFAKRNDNWIVYLQASAAD